MPDHEMFKEASGPGQKALFGILKCLAQLFPDCGYVQGMNYIVAPFMTVVKAELTLAILISLFKSDRF